MTIAVLADVHANLPAFDAVLANAAVVVPKGFSVWATP